MTQKVNIRSNINLLGPQIQRVQKYKYLGTSVMENYNHTTKIRTKIDTDKNAFVRNANTGWKAGQLNNNK